MLKAPTGNKLVVGFLPYLTTWHDAPKDHNVVILLILNFL
jgi:hypothetical protein